MLQRELDAQRERLLHARLARARRCADLAREALHCGAAIAGRELLDAAQSAERDALVALANLHLEQARESFDAARVAAGVLAIKSCCAHLEHALGEVRDAVNLVGDRDERG